MIEVLGYVASGIVVLSLAMTSVLKLRVISLIGAVLFAVYAALIGAVPIVIVNVAIIALNVYFLWRMVTDTEFFDTLEVRPDSHYVEGLVRFYHDDIARTQPAYRFEPDDRQFAVLVLRDMVPAGVFIGEDEGAGTMRVLLDYATPRYRDMKTGRYLYGAKQSVFSERGIDRLVSEGGSEPFERYLRRMGYEPQGDRYVLSLS